MKDKKISQAKSLASAPTRGQTNSPPRILVVDDNSDARELSVELLVGAGYEVEAVKDGAAGWDELQANHYDLIVTDNKMPRMTGIEMIEKLHSTRMQVPIIMVTGFYPTHEFARRPWLKPNATLESPFSNDDLLAAVKRVLREDDGKKGGNEARMAQTLAVSEISYRRLFEAAKDGILILDADTGRINDVNPFLIELLGFSRSEMIGKTIGDLSPFKDMVSNQVMLERLQRVGYVRYEDLPLETRDGRHIDVEFVSNVYQAGDCKVIQCNVRDITKRKAAEEALRESKEALRLTLAAAHIGYWELDLVTLTAIRSLQHDQIFGYAQLLSDWSYDKFLNHVHPDDQARVDQHLQAAVATKTGWDFECRIHRRDGALCWIWVHGYIYVNSTGKPARMLGMVSDITERKQAEEKIRQLNVELEQRVAERTAQLQAANQELEAFSYSVSHDLRAPLRHILGFVELLQKDAGPALSEKNLHLLATISQAAKRMGNLIDDLLAFSRIGQSEFQKTEVNLDELVKETLGDFQVETAERKIVWKIHPLPAVWADCALLRLVLVNLISNAVKFTGTRAQPKIEIGCAPGGYGSPREIGGADAMGQTQEAVSRGETVIFIRDNGAGFDPRYAAKLFGVFQRLHTQNEFEGTGIGLANVLRIIRRHGGRTWAQGVVDGGATFYFSIPNQPIEV